MVHITASGEGVNDKWEPSLPSPNRHMTARQVKMMDPNARQKLAATALVGSLAVQPALAQDITLEFVVWNYSLETVQDNVAQFEAENPGSRSTSRTMHGPTTMTA